MPEHQGVEKNEKIAKRAVLWYYDFLEWAQGSVHVFLYVGDQWIENQTLFASNGVSGDGFGSSIAVSEDKLIIGAYYLDDQGSSNPGKVYFFYYDGIEWSEQEWKDVPLTSEKCVDIHKISP